MDEEAYEYSLHSLMSVRGSAVWSDQNLLGSERLSWRLLSNEGGGEEEGGTGAVEEEGGTGGVEEEGGTGGIEEEGGTGGIEIEGGIADAEDKGGTTSGSTGLVVLWNS